MTTTAVHEFQGVDLTVAENVNTMLFRTGMTASLLARTIDISQPTLSRKLAGASAWGLTEVMRIADYFAVSLEEMTSALPPREEWEGRWVVRHQGLEPRTRWFGAFGADLRSLTRVDLMAVA